uniref:Transmembrane protein n=1 Tax=Steinernema glaseri TaxID=37863 RepID=A0A1I7YWF5_9BILA
MEGITALRGQNEICVAMSRNFVTLNSENSQLVLFGVLFGVFAVRFKLAFAMDTIDPTVNSVMSLEGPLKTGPPRIKMFIRY